MQFEVGKTVVHPQHGPATIVQVFQRTIRDEQQDYIELEVQRSDLKISVPVKLAEEIGIRDPRTVEELGELWEVLAAPTEHEEEQWSRRMKDNQERLRLGDLLSTAGVVRDLTRRSEAKGLSAGEKDMLRSAIQPIVVEVGLTLGISDEEAEQVLDNAIKGEIPALAG